MRNKTKEINKKAKISNVYDSIAESFDSKRTFPWQEVITFSKKINKDNKVLDLGCGNGRHTRLLLDQNLETFATDISYKILTIARENQLKQYYNQISGLINADGLQLPFRENYFDNIITIAVIHHLDTNNKRLMLLQEIHRTLKENGIAFISCWMKTHPRFIKEDLAEFIKKGKKDVYIPWNLSNGKKIMRYYYLFDSGELEELILQVGFNIISNEISNHNLFLTIRKK
ncbi:MAG: class I SAM-dependent methyltransferase [Asgard group archaeon]|nr:class I SAM-dependent methyltransferase [Asgard group archaeon]